MYPAVVMVYSFKLLNRTKISDLKYEF